MSVGSPAAADVPNLFDVVIDGKGYIFLRTIDTSLPFNTQRALYTRSPTFIDRTNTGSDYGDNQQSFWLTSTQKDWSLGEGQKFFRIGDDDSERRYWLGTNVDLSSPGQVAIGKATKSLTSAAAAYGCEWHYNDLYFTTSTNLYSVSQQGGNPVDKGAHGAGGPCYTLETDGRYLYMGGGGATSVRRYDDATTTFSTFTADQVNVLCYLNNTMYALWNGNLKSYDSAGTGTTLHTFKDAIGGARSSTQSPSDLFAYGGKVMILMRDLNVSQGDELWEYDGTGVAKVAEFPSTFGVRLACVVSGIAFFYGPEYDLQTGRQALYYYVNGSMGRAWISPQTGSNIGLSSVAVGNGIGFFDGVNGTIRKYDLVSGAVFTVGTTSATGLYDSAAYPGGGRFLMINRGSTTNHTFFFDSAYASSATVTSSLFDFNSTLNKNFRGVTVDFNNATDGDGGSVDISYRVGDLDGSYTTLQSNVTSGTEYTFSGVSGRSISIKVTLNKGTSTSGPVLKRVYVRAAPVLQSYRRREFIIDCSGRDGKTPVILNDNETPHPLDGLTQATNLNTSISTTTPISITDRFGTFTGIIEPDKSEIVELSPEEYIARITVREV